MVQMDLMVLRALVVLVHLGLHHFRDFHVHLLVQLYQLGQELLLDRLVQADRSHPVVRVYR